MSGRDTKSDSRRRAVGAAGRTSAESSLDGDVQSQLAILRAENARLSSELNESISHEAATSEVLKVISRSAFAPKHSRHCHRVGSQVM